MVSSLSLSSSTSDRRNKVSENERLQNTKTKKNDSFKKNNESAILKLLVVTSFPQNLRLSPGKTVIKIEKLKPPVSWLKMELNFGTFNWPM